MTGLGCNENRIVAPTRSNSSHAHRPWRATCAPEHDIKAYDRLSDAAALAVLPE